MKTFAIACSAGFALLAPAWCQLDPAIELNLMRQQQQNQKQYTQVDLSTDAGRKVYLREHQRYSGQYDGTDGSRKLQEAADELAAHDSPTKSPTSSGGSLYDSLKSSNPSLTKDSLRTMSESDVRALLYNKFRQEGKSMSEARQLAAIAPIPANR
jgi:hypothetical protein